MGASSEAMKLLLLMALASCWPNTVILRGQRTTTHDIQPCVVVVPPVSPNPNVFEQCDAYVAAGFKREDCGMLYYEAWSDYGKAAYMYITLYVWPICSLIADHANQ